jgi:hypothetical protein
MEKPVVQLVGEDGNIFSIVGRCTRALKKAGMKKEADEMWERVQKAMSYDMALSIILEYVDAE